MRESPSLVNGVRFRSLSLRSSWVRIPPPAYYNFLIQTTAGILHQNDFCESNSTRLSPHASNAEVVTQLVSWAQNLLSLVCLGVLHNNSYDGCTCMCEREKHGGGGEERRGSNLYIQHHPTFIFFRIFQVAK